VPCLGWRKTIPSDKGSRHRERDNGANRRKIRIHGLRGTFVTISLANGKTETWVADRTGHRSSAMVNRYRRQARSAKELGLGELRPLNQPLAGQFCPCLAHEHTQRVYTTKQATSAEQAQWPLGGMADAGDLKSFTRKGFPVRIREGLPRERCRIVGVVRETKPAR
jgi:hypothetical protein